MARAFHPIETDDVHTISFRGQGMPNGNTLVNGNEASFFESFDEFFGRGAGSLNYLHPLLDDDRGVFVVWGRLSHGGQNRQVNAKGLGR